LAPNVPSTRRCLVGEARRNSLLGMADAAAKEKNGARNVPCLERLYDVVAPVRSPFGELPAYVCDRSAELDLQRKPRQRLDERRISGLLGNVSVKFPIKHRIGFRVSTLHGDHGCNEYIFKPLDIAVAHLRYRKFNRKTFKPLEQFVEIRGLAARKAADIISAIRLDLHHPPFARIPIASRNGIRLTRSLCITCFSSTHPPLGNSPDTIRCTSSS
jgi:hypothetical protein